MIESAMAVRFASSHRSFWNADECPGVHVSSRRISHSGSFDIPCYQRFNGGSLIKKKNVVRNKVRATAEHLGSASEPAKCNGSAGYHPFEDVAELASGGDATLTAAETSRTIVEVNTKATLLFSGMIDDEIHENILWSELPYVTDEQGNIYFQVNNDEDIIQTLASEGNVVQVIIGLDTTDMLNGMEVSSPADIEFGIEEIGEDDSDFEDDEDEDEDEDGEDDDYGEDWVSVLDDEDDEDQSDGDPGDWAQLETMRSSHPMYFAKKLAEVASDDPVNWMERPPVGIVIQGLLSPALLEKHSTNQRHLSSHHSGAEINHTGSILEDKQVDSSTTDADRQEHSLEDGPSRAEELSKNGSPRSEKSLYKLEMINIQLLSVHGHPHTVEVEDFRKAQPDAIAHSAAKIISRLKVGEEKTIQALKSLCWRCKGIQVEEAMIIGVDALGFDARVCSGTQLQTLRFAFHARATSEQSAERQLSNLLFPRAQHKPHNKKKAH
ncbi:uncharacterized protein At3g49140-like isoform X2 [Rhodamnia argentea]|uniref:Uncharacterized protein At3g49140-like isoform X2 n=1 Tax=Rhodamnia argentea TaxID=178133 RepID=A0A8B8PED9_9MYRT|nr:uncharacterized protein At3g49140-like isoform X2 [Rhodamnia argentea]